jgi:hypothetical protein
VSCELPEWCDEVERTCSGRAKKSLKCCECGGEIAQGLRYVEYKGVWSGDFEVYRFHWLCHEIMRKRNAYLHSVVRLSEDEVPGFGELVDSAREDTRESGGEVPSWWPKDLPMTQEALAKAAAEGGAS